MILAGFGVYTKYFTDSKFLSSDKIQTTPQLFGWLFYEDFLVDSDKDIIMNDHVELKRPLEKYFDQMYREAMLMKLRKSVGGVENRVNAEK